VATPGSSFIALPTIYRKSILNPGLRGEVYYDFTTPTPSIKLQIQTILNRVEKRMGFVYPKASFDKKAKSTARKACGFKDLETITTALYHQLGDLPNLRSFPPFRFALVGIDCYSLCRYRLAC
jgi:hypothetical protein